LRDKSATERQGGGQCQSWGYDNGDGEEDDDNQGDNKNKKK